ncbi:DET1 homolog [Galendromus occidentalis]|uniref:DET1 homolog n=1 Tax=Galendromus occidentalis TaxID=34638 RepID=A0AAJ6VZA4_9ACAR|nr:DET1 homolog [Galendromus occidentalis]
MGTKRKYESDQEVPDEDWLHPRKIPNQNLLCRLMQREAYACRQRVNAALISRQLHQNVVPRFTILGIDKPAVFLKKFTLDGKYLFAFSSDQTCIQLFKYLGPQGGASLINDLPGDHTTDTRVVHEAFGKYFRHLHCVVVISDAHEQLNRECSIFTNDGRYLIVASSGACGREPEPAQIFTTNESLKINNQFPCEDIAFHLIDIHRGVVCDRLTFKVDRILLTHNHGIYLYNQTLAILSLQHQTIHIYNVDGGKFTKKHEIGRFLFPDDQQLVDSVEPVRDPSGAIMPTSGEAWLNSLKHRLLAALYRKSAGDTRQIREFCQLFGAINQLRIGKMQLLDEDHLLIKYVKEKSLQTRSQDATGPSLFSVYRISVGEVVDVYTNTSEELLHLADNFCEYFRNLPSTCSPSNNANAKLILQRFKQTILNARFGGQQEMVKRLLSQLPISCQSFSASPYLDLSLFSYDDKWVSMFERPKGAGEYPIKFYCRDSGLLRYKMHTNQHIQSNRPPQKRLAAFTFHPKDPFVISVQRINGDYIVNFHVPNDNHHRRFQNSGSSSMDTRL